jgi:hypothetical protein
MLNNNLTFSLMQTKDLLKSNESVGILYSISGKYLDTLNEGINKIVFDVDGGIDPVLTIDVKNTTSKTDNDSEKTDNGTTDNGKKDNGKKDNGKTDNGKSDGKYSGDNSDSSGNNSNGKDNSLIKTSNKTAANTGDSSELTNNSIAVMICILAFSCIAVISSKTKFKRKH